MMVKWQIEDGYAGGKRPQETEVDDEELAAFETEEERKEFIYYCIQQDFEEKISWCRI